MNDGGDHGATTVLVQRINHQLIPTIKPIKKLVALYKAIISKALCSEKDSAIRGGVSPVQEVTYGMSAM